MKKIVLIYGNCQAGVFADAFKIYDDLMATHDVHYVASFDDPTGPEETMPSAEELSRCSLVLEQNDTSHPLPAAVRQQLPQTTPIMRFPSLNFNLLWPLNFNDPRNVSELPDFPFGRFPYGDRAVAELLREGLTGTALWEAYQERSLQRLPDLGRLRILEEARLAALDTDADVKVCGLVMDSFAEKRLFWTINHPTGWLLGQVFGNLLYVASRHLSIAADPRPKAEAFFASYEPFANQHQPIHPVVAKRLGLKWCTPDMTYRYFDGTMMTFEAFMLRYIDFR